MSLTRKTLKNMGIEDEKIDQIIEDHAETVQALKQRAEAAEERAATLAEVQKELDELKSQPDDGFKDKYEAIKAEYETYKQDVANQKSAAEKRELYKGLLTKSGMGAKYLDRVLKVTDLASVEVEDGAIKDAEKLAEQIKSDWPEFISSKSQVGANVQNPPSNGNEPTNLENLSIEEYIEARKKMKR